MLALRKVTIIGVGVKNNHRYYHVTTIVNGKPVVMDLDTCAEITIVSPEVYNQLGRPRLETAPRLRAYG